MYDFTVLRKQTNKSILDLIINTYKSVQFLWLNTAIYQTCGTTQETYCFQRTFFKIQFWLFMTSLALLYVTRKQDIF